MSWEHDAALRWDRMNTPARDEDNAPDESDEEPETDDSTRE